ncbi:hypothetical protein Tco_0085591 [Tanacetum coccineum]
MRGSHTWWQLFSSTPSRLRAGPEEQSEASLRQNYSPVYVRSPIPDGQDPEGGWRRGPEEVPILTILLMVPIPAWSGDAEVATSHYIYSHLHHHLPMPIRSLGYRAAMIRMRAKAASTSHSLPLPPPFILYPTRLDAPSLGIPPPLPISVPTSSPPLLLPSASRREDRPEVTLPPRKRLGIALGPGYEVGESSSAATTRPAGGLRVDYGFVTTMDREIRHDPE